MVGNGDPAIQWLVSRARGDAFFLGQTLAEYQAMHGMDDRELGGMLQCAPEALGRLALCRRPDDQTAEFREDVLRIAALASCSAERLVQLLREVAAVASLRQGRGETSAHGMLMAARDRRSRGKPTGKPAAGKKRSKRERKE